MLKEDNLDLFLDAFFGCEGDLRTEAIEFREEEEPSGQACRWETGEFSAAPVSRGKLTKRTVFSLLLLGIAIPVTVWAGVTLFDDRKYLVTGLIIAVYSMIPFFLVFEGRKPRARELLTISVLVAVAVAGRAAFFMVPNFKPVAAITIIAAVSFGAESGFLVGSVSMLVSNMFMGQGPWTPWQMCAMGAVGFIAGLLFQKGWLKAKKLPLCVFGFLATLIIYGGIMNPASLVMFSGAVTPRGLLAVYMAGLPMDLVHAFSTVIFLWLTAGPFLEKLERIKVKYDLIRTSRPHPQDGTVTAKS